VDLQHDFLERSDLVPESVSLCAQVGALLRVWRRRGLPVAHAHTVTRADGTDRMPHWTRRGLRACVEGTRGVEPPAELAPAPGELVARKRFFDAFADPALDPWLRGHGVARIVLAGVYLHGCIRATALAAYERGYEVCVVDDAVGTTEPVHAELTRAYLAERAAAFRSAADVLAELEDPARPARPSGGRPVLPVAVIGGVRRDAAGHARLARRDPCRTAEVVTEVPLGGAAEVADAARASAEAQHEWARTDPLTRAAALERWADRLEADRTAFTNRLVREVAKPRRAADEEVGRAVAHARVAAELVRATSTTRVAPGVVVRARPVGVVGLVTPWNNPVAIPVGKIAPALGFGNAVVLKPAPEGAETTLALLDSLAAAGVPAGLVNVVLGGPEAVRALCLDPRVAAVSVTGAVATGRVAAALCASAMKPLQAELGGNNAAIVCRDADLDAVAGDLVRAAYGFTGQRCTAIRRLVVERAVAADLEARLVTAIGALRVGVPDDPATDIGPLVSAGARDRVLATIDRAVAAGARLVAGGVVPPGLAGGAWLAPTLLADAAPESAVVQEETFGPLAVLQVARDLDDAIALANAVPHGLVQSVHTRDAATRARVLDAAEAGIVQLAAGLLAVHPRAPFGGWKASGLGPPEHGIWDAAFYSRSQAVYGDAGC
jgi:acyl-CoA reductase-like NAD-dependent aldehyde dehydrogenase/nicotinamidase-related amidase